MRRIYLLLFTGFLIMAISCGPRVQTERPTNVNLEKYDTFAFLPNANVEVQDRNYNDENINSMIVETVNQNMREAGYSLDRDNPDLLVLISTSTEIEREMTTSPVYAAYPYGAGVTTIGPWYEPYYYRGYNTFGGGVIGYDTDTYAYEEGTVVINLIDRETKETVWKGMTSDALYDQPNTQAMRELVNEIFEEYPLN